MIYIEHVMLTRNHVRSLRSPTQCDQLWRCCESHCNRVLLRDRCFTWQPSISCFTRFGCHRKDGPLGLSNRPAEMPPAVLPTDPSWSFQATVPPPLGRRHHRRRGSPAGRRELGAPGAVVERSEVGGGAVGGRRLGGTSGGREPWVLTGGRTVWWWREGGKIRQKDVWIGLIGCSRL